jgi:hypothetical protein
VVSWRSRIGWDQGIYPAGVADGGGPVPLATAMKKIMPRAIQLCKIPLNHGKIL